LCCGLIYFLYLDSIGTIGTKLFVFFLWLTNWRFCDSLYGYGYASLMETVNGWRSGSGME